MTSERIPEDRSTAESARRRLGPGSMPPHVFVVGSVISIQVGQARGKALFGTVGAYGVVCLRLVFAAAVLLVLWRPRLPRSWRERGLIMALGTAIAGMNIVYLALERLPVGVATTLQLLGPLVLALAGSRRLIDLVWAALAWAGVLLFWNPFGTGGDLSTTGVVLGLVSGVAMAVYVVLNKKAGALSADGTFLAYAVLWAALLSLPAGLTQAGGRLFEPWVLAAGFGVAVLSAVLPYTLDMAALRRLPSRIVAVLESLEPAVGGLAAVIILGELLTTLQWAGVACVVVASVGTFLLSDRSAKNRTDDQERHREERGNIPEAGHTQERADGSLQRRGQASHASSVPSRGTPVAGRQGHSQ